VAPNGTAEGSGTEADPLDLATALSTESPVQPGDSVLVHGGVYEGNFVGELSGSETEPITVQSAPGEWAVIDGATSAETTLTLNGAWTVYRDFEVTNTNLERWGERATGFYVGGPNLTLVNLVAHDLGNNGFWTPAENLLVYGCLIYHTGYDDEDRGHGHAIYTQNETGTKRFVDNILFGGYSFGVHAYTEGGSIQGFEFEGNTWFNVGICSTVSDHKDDCLVGGLQPAARIVLRENYSWATSPTGRTIRLGYSVPNEDVALLDNYVVGETNFAQPWSSIEMTGNTFYSAVVGIDPASYPDNDYLTERPVGAQVFVRPNQYEDGRANIIVYNWDEEASLPADVSGVLTDGDEWELRDAQNYLAGTVATGTFRGDPIDLPMDLDDAAQPIGDPATPYPHTPPEFGVFVLTRVGNAGPDDGGTEGSDGDGGSDGGGSDDGATGGSTGNDTTGGTSTGGDATGGGSSDSGGCGCRSTGSQSGHATGLACLVLALAALRRRRRRLGALH
jgi:MYXO-CTERM domain-containing protein